MKKIFLKIEILVIIAILIVPALQTRAAEGEYTVLAPLPCIGSDQDCKTSATKTTLTDYVPGMFKIAIGLSAAAAVLMIVFGGFQYITTDAIQGKKEGKDRILNAIYGLVLVISAWLILNTINPNLLHINLNVESVVVATQPGITLGGELSAGTGKILPGYTLSATEVKTNADMVKDLKDKFGINVNNGGKPCTNGEVGGCTNLVGLPENAYSGVKSIKEDCPSCSAITITGGSEGGHASHGPNLPVLDLGTNDPALNTYIENHKIKPAETTSLGPVYTLKLANGTNATFLRESNPPHWHTVFGGK